MYYCIPLGATLHTFYPAPSAPCTQQRVIFSTHLRLRSKPLQAKEKEQPAERKRPVNQKEGHERLHNAQL